MATTAPVVPMTTTLPTEAILEAAAAMWEMDTLFVALFGGKTELGEAALALLGAAAGLSPSDDDYIDGPLVDEMYSRANERSAERCDDIAAQIPE